MSSRSVASRPVPWLVFDGDCAFCTSSATWVSHRLHRTTVPDVHLVPWQITDLAGLGLTAKRAQFEALLVLPDGTIHGGAFAFAHWLRYRGGAYGVLGSAMLLPGVRSLAAAVYRVAARNRQRMPGGTPACALPPAGTIPPGRPSTP